MLRLAILLVALILMGANSPNDPPKSVIDNPILMTMQDSDGDGVPDATDIDDDNDGIIDTREELPCTFTPSSSVGQGTNLRNGTEPYGNGCTSGNGSTNIWSAGIYTENDKRGAYWAFWDVTCKPGVPLTVNFNLSSVNQHWAGNGRSIGKLQIAGSQRATVDNNFAGVRSSYTFTPTTSTFQIRLEIEMIRTSFNCGDLNLPELRLDFNFPPQTFVDSTCPTVDFDQDGLGNQVDQDSDNDGILDNVEAQALATYIAPTDTTDSDGNGLYDIYESTPGAGEGLIPINSDSHGQPNFIDLDSDNDGCADSIEAGHQDVDDDGFLGTSPVHVNNLGLVQNQGGYTGTNTYVVQDTSNAFSITDHPHDITVCEGEIADFAVIVAGNNIAYQWQQFDGSQFNDLLDGSIFSGTNAHTLHINNQDNTQDNTTYRVIVTSPENKCMVFTSDPATLSINNMTAGVIASDPANCGNDPDMFTETTTASGDGTLSFQWQQSTDGNTFTDISGATSHTFDSGTLTSDTWFRRMDTSTLNGTTCSLLTNSIRITLHNLIPGTITGEQIICEGDTPQTFSETASATANGVISHQWQESTDGNTFTDIPNATDPSFGPSGLTVDTWYRRWDISTFNGVACGTPTNIIKITVNNITPATLMGQTVCAGDDPTPINITSMAFADGNLSHQWQSSVDGTNFANLPGATNATLDPPVVSQDTWYRRMDTSILHGHLCTAVSNSIKIEVNTVIAGRITENQTICHGDTPLTITEDIMATPEGTLTHQWQSSVDGVNFEDIPNEISNSVSLGPLIQDTWFRRLDTSTLNGQTCTATTNTVKITINAITAGILEGDQIICMGGIPSPIQQATPAVAEGIISHAWESSSNGIDFTPISHATGPSFQPGALDQDRWYRRVDMSTLDSVQCSQTTHTVHITVNNLASGVIRNEEAICEGDDPEAFIIESPTVGDGTITYQWQLSTNGEDFNDIPGATSEIFDPQPMEGETWYRRIDTSTLGENSCQLPTNTFKIGIFETLKAELTVNYFCQEGTNGTQNVVDIRLLNVSQELSGTLFSLRDSQDQLQDALEPQFTNVQRGTYLVEVLNSNGCLNILGQIIVAPPQPLSVRLDESVPDTIVPIVSGGSGEYRYSYDGGEFSSDNHYFITETRTYTVTVLDYQLGCTLSLEVPMEFTGIAIPNFFSPNGDSFNEGWSPEHIENFPESIIEIYDRQGRKLINLPPGEKWDGKYKGNDLPSGDYWYIVRVRKEHYRKEYMGNFSLWR